MCKDMYRHEMCLYFNWASILHTTVGGWEMDSRKGREGGIAVVSGKVMLALGEGGRGDEAGGVNGLMTILRQRRLDWLSTHFRVMCVWKRRRRRRRRRKRRCEEVVWSATASNSCLVFFSDKQGSALCFSFVPNLSYLSFLLLLLLLLLFQVLHRHLRSRRKEKIQKFTTGKERKIRRRK